MVAWFATPRQRLRVYIVLAAIAGLGCAGVNYTINANLMSCAITTPSQQACTQAASARGCSPAPAWDSGSQICSLTDCSKPCANPSTPVTNCPFPVAHSGPACQSLAQAAGCTSAEYNDSAGTIPANRCVGFNCTNLDCGGP